MHFTLYTTLTAAAAAVLFTTGLSATASPSPSPNPNGIPVQNAAIHGDGGGDAHGVSVSDPLAQPAPHPLYQLPPPFAARSLRGSGRRVSRKKGRRHLTSTATAYVTVTSDAPSSSASASSSSSSHHHGAGTRTVTEYTTVTSASASAVTTPTDSSAPTDSSSDTSSPTPTDTTTAASTSTDSSPSSSSTSTDASSSAPAPTSTGGVIVAHSDQCGDPNGTETPTTTGGPNGDEQWLNCGVDGAGWVPPPVTLSNLVYKDLSTVLQTPGNPFTACEPYLTMFESQSTSTGIPTIFLASIALQESGCNPTVTGGAGEIGMMQITSEKCPTDGTDCFDAATNIRIGAEYFKRTLDANAGNLAATMGEYNGWYVGLTTTLANNYAYCAQHNNLDYLQNVFNGYLQGVDPLQNHFGIYHNTCP